MRKAVIALAAALLSCSPALSGDFAAFQSIGFSPDGKVFAFEEYGIQDGSGFPYASIYVIDTERDSFISGTPIRVRIDDEQAGLSAARAEAMAKAKPLISKHQLLDHPGVLAAFNPVGELGADRGRINYSPYTVEPMQGRTFALALDEFPLPLTDKCRDLTPEGGKGFRLRLVEWDGAPVDRTVYADSRVPDSRNCPRSYQLSGVVAHHPFDADPVHMALVLVRSFGFEGNDGRWIAIPVRP